MIKLKINSMMDERKITRYRVNKNTGWNYRRVNALYKGKVKYITLDEMDNLCNILECKIQDLIEKV